MLLFILLLLVSSPGRMFGCLVLWSVVVLVLSSGVWGFVLVVVLVLVAKVLYVFVRVVWLWGMVGVGLRLVMLQLFILWTPEFRHGHLQDCLLFLYFLQKMLSDLLWLEVLVW